MSDKESVCLKFEFGGAWANERAAFSMTPHSASRKFLIRLSSSNKKHRQLYGQMMHKSKDQYSKHYFSYDYEKNIKIYRTSCFRDFFFSMAQKSQKVLEKF